MHPDNGTPKKWVLDVDIGVGVSTPNTPIIGCIYTYTYTQYTYYWVYPHLHLHPIHLLLGVSTPTPMSTPILIFHCNQYFSFKINLKYTNSIKLKRIYLFFIFLT